MNKIFIGLCLLSIASFSFGIGKYCGEEGSSYTVHLFGSSFANDQHKRSFLRGVDALNEKLKRGDALKIIFHKPKGDYRVVMDACVPGCPETSVIGSLTAECSAQIAKKDRVEFKNRYLSAVKRAAASDQKGYNVFHDLVTLSDYYRGRGKTRGDVYVFHSLVPKGLGNGASEKDFDAAFVQLVQNKKALPTSLPKLSFVNPDTGKLNYEFWQDIQELLGEGSLKFVTLE